MLMRSKYTHAKPAPRKQAGPPRPITDDVIWTRTVEPRERYRIVYLDRENNRGERTIELSKIGHSGEHIYLGVTDQGKFKTMRADRVVEVLEQLTTGHAPTVVAAPQYSTSLPSFPIENKVVKVPASAAHSTRTWTVDLNRYTCTCPEKRLRGPKGYKPGQLGMCCDHIAKAILQNWPEGNPAWTAELKTFLSDPRKMHLDNVVSA